MLNWKKTTHHISSYFLVKMEHLFVTGGPRIIWRYRTAGEIFPFFLLQEKNLLFVIYFPNGKKLQPEFTSSKIGYNCLWMWLASIFFFMYLIKLKFGLQSEHWVFAYIVKQYFVGVIRKNDDINKTEKKGENYKDMNVGRNGFWYSSKQL